MSDINAPLINGLEKIIPDSEAHWQELRTRDITSTDASALFGLSPYLTKFELWHRKKSQSHIEIQETERMRWGNRLEAAIAAGVAEDVGLNISPMKEYMRLADIKMGSSFDFSIDGDTPGILEIKNVDSMAFKNSWLQHEDGTIDAPPHIEIQLQHQFAVSGRTWGFIAALVGGNTIYLLKRQADPDIIQRIKLKATKFWESVESNTPPEPDYHKDAEFICSLYSLANPGKVLTASPSLAELVEQYKMVSDKLKILDEEKTAIKAQILVEIGDAEKVLGDNFTISAGVVGPAKISYERKGYRSFKVNFKKTKGDE